MTSAIVSSDELARLKAAPGEEGAHDLIRRRWSPRAFADRPIPAGDLRTLLNAARWAASSFNEQPWRFIVATQAEPEAYGKLLGSLVEANQRWAKNAPVLMLTAGKRTFSHNGSPNPYALHDAGMALANLMFQATAMGLAVHAMGGFDRAKARAAFGIPEDYELGAAVAIGYPGNPADLPEALRSVETAPRSRKPLSELAYSGAWGQPAAL